MSVPILSARAIVKAFGGRHWFGGADAKHAIDKVDLDVNEGETLAIVGESGSGKSTLARILLGLIRPTSGTVAYFGRPVDGFAAADWATFRKAVQPVFQDPASSLNPRMRVDTTLSNVLRRHKLATRATLEAEITELLASVVSRSIPAPIVRRTAAAHCDRAGHGGAAPADHCRRAVVEP